MGELINYLNHNYKAKMSLSMSPLGSFWQKLDYYHFQNSEILPAATSCNLWLRESVKNLVAGTVGIRNHIHTNTKKLILMAEKNLLKTWLTKLFKSELQIWSRHRPYSVNSTLNVGTDINGCPNSCGNFKKQTSKQGHAWLCKHNSGVFYLLISSFFFSYFFYYGDPKPDAVCHLKLGIKITNKFEFLWKKQGGAAFTLHWSVESKM